MLKCRIDVKGMSWIFYRKLLDLRKGFPLEKVGLQGDCTLCFSIYKITQCIKNNKYIFYIPCSVACYTKI